MHPFFRAPSPAMKTSHMTRQSAAGGKPTLHPRRSVGQSSGTCLTRPPKVSTASPPSTSGTTCATTYGMWYRHVAPRMRFLIYFNCLLETDLGSDLPTYRSAYPATLATVHCVPQGSLLTTKAFSRYSLTCLDSRNGQDLRTCSSHRSDRRSRRANSTGRPKGRSGSRSRRRSPGCRRSGS
jgi:hypothetical protein